LGDYGCNDVLGRPEGVIQVHSYLSKIGYRVRPILGNHDFQYETGKNIYPHGTISNLLHKLFKIDYHHGVEEFEDFRLFFLSTDPQPAESYYYNQECYISDEHFKWLTEKLNERPGVPALFFSHAPPIGSGLITVPDVHVRATNAFLDQNHDPYRWFELIKKYPEIVLWFSAHYHIGHMHKKSINEKLGTFFFMCGVHSSVTRDGYRQSRVIDITDNLIQVKTLDHKKREILDIESWKYKGNIGELVAQKSNKLKMCRSADNMNICNSMQIGSILLNRDSTIKVIGDFTTGMGLVRLNGITCSENEHIFVATQNGYLWEIDVKYGEALGTLHYKEKPVRCMTVTGNLIWKIRKNNIAVCDIYSHYRFIWEQYDKQQMLAYCSTNDNLQCICGRSNNSALVGSCNKLLEVTISHEKLDFKEICEVDSEIKHIACISNDICFRTANEENFIYNSDSQCLNKIGNGVIYDTSDESFKRR